MEVRSTLPRRRSAGRVCRRGRSACIRQRVEDQNGGLGPQIRPNGPNASSPTNTVQRGLHPNTQNVWSVSHSSATPMALAHSLRLTLCAAKKPSPNMPQTNQLFALRPSGMCGCCSSQALITERSRRTTFDKNHSATARCCLFPQPLI